MPYVYKEILDDGDKAADVLERDLVDAIADERDEAKSQVETLTNERDSLQEQLNSAKRKFADAFLSSPQRAEHEDKPKDPEPVSNSISSYNTLFDWSE